MRVVQANKAYLPHIGGVETVVRQLAEGVYSRHGCVSSVIACSDHSGTCKEVHNGVNVTTVGTVARIKSLPICPGFTRHLMREQADILMIHEPFLLGGLAYITRKRLAERRFKRLVVWWHSDIVRQRMLRPAYAPLQRALLTEAHAILVATPRHIQTSEFLTEFVDKCHIVHYGIDPKRYESTPQIEANVAALRAKYGRPIIFFTGRLVYYKGVEYLVEAMKQVPEAQLVIVGKGPLLPVLKQLATEGPGNVTFIPYLQETELVEMYHAADVFVLPSVEVSEAFGIVQIEAMACGTPVVSTDLHTGVTYVNRDGETGLVVPKRDPVALVRAIRLLLQNHEMRQRLGSTARARILREFTVDQMVDQVAYLSEQLLQTRLTSFS